MAVRYDRADIYDLLENVAHRQERFIRKKETAHVLKRANSALLGECAVFCVFSQALWVFASFAA